MGQVATLDEVQSSSWVQEVAWVQQELPLSPVVEALKPHASGHMVGAASEHEEEFFLEVREVEFSSGVLLFWVEEPEVSFAALAF